MAPRQRTRCWSAACLTVLLALVVVSSAQAQAVDDPAAAPIAQRDITALQEELAQSSTASSASRKRRGYKNVVRDGAALIEALPSAPNRFRVLAIMLQSQKRLLLLENSEQNRQGLYEICTQLAQAPDSYAVIRLDADLLLSDRDLTLDDADVNERAVALKALVTRYRDTPGEVKSLQIAYQIAPKLEAFDLQKDLLATLSERFTGDHEVTIWRRDHLGLSKLDVLFSGTYTRSDGVALSFPSDTMGHTCLIYFWSKDTPDYQTHLASIKALQSEFPGQFRVFSFNVDELPDAGEAILRKLGLDWTAMHLPGGRQSLAYRAYATKDPLGVRINAHGHAFIGLTPKHFDIETTPMQDNLDDVRYLAQLQSLFIGDFLVTDSDAGNKSAPAAGSVPAQTLSAIQACFTAVPMRYRLTREQALANYTKAEALCRDAIAQNADAPDLWRVRNCRMIALLGMWNQATEPKHLEAAVEEARAALASDLPKGADVVPRFCLAKATLRQGMVAPDSVLSDLIKATGEDEAPASAYAAAAILAMDANEKDLHAKYRQVLLDAPNDSPMLWPVVSFLRDQNHTIRLFKANYYHPPSMARRRVRGALRQNTIARNIPADTNGPLTTELLTLAGDAINFPEATDGKMTLLMFVEPPADPDADLPVVINGSVTENANGQKLEVAGMMQRAFALADQEVDGQIKVVAAFLSDDTARVKGLMEKHNWPCQTFMVPGGLNHPLVRQLGILSADRVPNIVLLRPDGTIAWKISGLVHPQHRSEGVGELMHAINLGMTINIKQLEMEASIKALTKGDLQQAVKLFSGPFPPPTRPNPDGWIAPRQLVGAVTITHGPSRYEALHQRIDEAKIPGRN